MVLMAKRLNRFYRCYVAACYEGIHRRLTDSLQASGALAKSKTVRMPRGTCIALPSAIHASDIVDQRYCPRRGHPPGLGAR